MLRVTIHHDQGGDSEVARLDECRVEGGRLSLVAAVTGDDGTGR
jgi:hypothetical protein